MTKITPYYTEQPETARHHSRIIFVLVFLLALIGTTVALAVTLPNNNGSTSTPPTTSTTVTQPVTPGTGGNSSSVSTDTNTHNNTQTQPGTGGNSTSVPGTGNTATTAPSNTGNENTQNNDDSNGEELSDSTVISSSNPTIGITHLGDVIYVIKKAVFDFFRGGVNILMSGCAFCMSIMDAATDPLLTSEFAGGAFQRLYDVASEVAHVVGIPFGTAILGISFTIAMVENSERARRYETRNAAFDVVMLVLSLAVGLALIYHAVDLCALIFNLSTGVVRLLKQALSNVGIASSGSLISDSLQQGVLGAMDQLTYGDVGMSLGYLIVALAMALLCFTVMTWVILQALLRMGEVYLRAAFSPIVIGFGSAKSTRPMAIQYLKRFGAVALSAALIIMSLAVSGLLFQITSDVISPITSTVSGGWQALLAGLVPTVVAVSAVRELVKRSQQVSASIFGLN